MDEIEIIVKKSKRRKKTISATLEHNIMRVSAPATISDKELNRVIEKLKKRLEKREKVKKLNKDETLKKRAHELNKKFFNGKLQYKSIKYSVNQTTIFGLCNCTNGTININACLKDMPKWVEDYVIMHELAHLIQPDHSKKFWQIVNKYPKTERAIGYLIAKGIESDEE